MKNKLLTVIFIGGAGHSGSTLLGLLLGGNSRCFYGGELKNTRFLGSEQTPLLKRVCKLCGPECRFWNNFAPDGKQFYEEIAERAQRPVVVDSTKDTKWIEKQIQNYKGRNINLIFIYLTRDGRAVFNSRLRKKKHSPQQIIANWKQQIAATDCLFQQFEGAKLRVAYEKLIQQPQAVLEAVCQSAGLHFEPQMLNFADHVQHPLGGNNGTQYVAGSAGQQSDFVKLTERTRYYYEHHGAVLKHDLRWKTELSDEMLQLFEKEAGELNQRFEWTK